MALIDPKVLDKLLTTTTIDKHVEEPSPFGSLIASPRDPGKSVVSEQLSKLPHEVEQAALDREISKSAVFGMEYGGLEARVMDRYGLTATEIKERYMESYRWPVSGLKGADKKDYTKLAEAIQAMHDPIRSALSAHGGATTPQILEIIAAQIGLVLGAENPDRFDSFEFAALALKPKL